MKIKICGLNPTRDVQLCIDLKVNYLGFVFYKKSPRNVSLSDIKILSKYNKKNSFFVAVTVNPSDDFINQNLIGNRRPFSNGELFSLFLLIIIISISLIGSIFIASFTGKELETIPLWLIK